VEFNEKVRLQALRRYKILDTDPEEAFDDLTILASHICETPVAMISLIDSDRQWFKSKHGLNVSETPRAVSFCAVAIQQPDLFVVPDASKDPRFSSNPFVVSDPKIRFYAGAPFTSSDGHPLGTLCVVDMVPRELTPSQETALLALFNILPASKRASETIAHKPTRTRAGGAERMQQLPEFALRWNAIFFEAFQAARFGNFVLI
jgi:GAF domain-containing protein